MYTTLEAYSGFWSITNYEGDEVDLDMEMVLTLGMMEIWWRHSLLHKRWVGDDDGGDFPKEEASEQ
jgi:hypothetical protein